MSRLLAVDDSQLVIKILDHTLSNAGYGFVSCGEGRTALSLAESVHPDIILLDIIMPDITGLEVLARLKDKPAMASLPVIILASRTDPEDVATALEAGAFDYIRKPVEPIEVLARIRSALRIREYEEKLEYSSTHDGLTGLYNHVETLSILESELSVARDKRQAFSVAMIDIDHFKKVNDLHGHQVGDTVLRGLGAMISSTFGAVGTAGRYGCEEFFIVLRNFDTAMAGMSLEAFRKAVEEHTWPAAS
ncbi:MAG: diguanylate cyclase [Spirochaetes bacterium]|nr:diguanylate cyclase [Spirochaetota bacterium]